MKKDMDIDSIMTPFAGEKPAGEDLRYSPIYTEITEARRAEDPLDRGDSKREIKKADWEKVLVLSVEALTKKTKDLQIAAWLTEALIRTEGFSGLGMGLSIVNGLLRNCWENLYPLIEEGDLDFRAAPIEFMNSKLWVSIREIPLTDSTVTAGFSWLKWQESGEVGYERDTLNRFGSVEESKKNRRDELIAEGKVTAEDFEAAVALSSRSYYESLAGAVRVCGEEFKALDEIVDQKFGPHAPRLAEFRAALEDCERFVTMRLDDKKKLEPDLQPAPAVEKAAPSHPETKWETGLQVPAVSEKTPSMTVPSFSGKEFAEVATLEKVVWEEALQLMGTSGMKEALGQLLAVANSAPSTRERNRYRLLMARLCLMAGRPDLARPIVEELQALLEELHLERWESPVWIAEVLDALYQCLTQGEPTDEDIGRAKALFRRLCTTDITRAMGYKA